MTCRTPVGGWVRLCQPCFSSWRERAETFCVFGCRSRLRVRPAGLTSCGILCFCIVLFCIILKSFSVAASGILLCTPLQRSALPSRPSKFSEGAWRPWQAAGASGNLWQTLWALGICAAGHGTLWEVFGDPWGCERCFRKLWEADVRGVCYPREFLGHEAPKHQNLHYFGVRTPPFLAHANSCFLNPGSRTSSI